ncbi:MAG: glucose-6-phosphate dehydrogenase, partial [Pseudomonadales bacterium]
MKNATDIVIFGGLGDLSVRKLLPALYHSEAGNQLAAQSRIFLISKEDVTDQGCIELVNTALKQHLAPGEFDRAHWDSFSQRIAHFNIDLMTLDGRWEPLKQRIEATGNSSRVYYFAIPPSLYGQTCAHLNTKDLITPDTRVVLEKPIGYDHASADEINAQVAAFFEEDNIYRIDHYLGKETVQNLMALRFGNVLFEPLWDCKTIDRVEISIAESVGLEGRTAFYDKAGALRDMVQNHLLQLLCLLTMEPPAKLDADNIRAEKLKVLKALSRIDEHNVTTDTIRGQYTAGVVGGKSVPGYQEELEAESRGSRTETYVAIKTHIDNWRWSGVPFYLRTGKRLAERFAEIVIHYKSVSHNVFDEDAGPLQPNRLVMRLQPDERMQLTLMSKELNRQGIRLRPATLNLNFADTFKYTKSDAYQRLIIDAVQGNPALFTHRDEVE